MDNSEKSAAGEGSLSPAALRFAPTGTVATLAVDRLSGHNDGGQTITPTFPFADRQHEQRTSVWKTRDYRTM